jgi:hypothetical protein
MNMFKLASLRQVLLRNSLARRTQRELSGYWYVERKKNHECVINRKESFSKPTILRVVSGFNKLNQMKE